MVSQGENILIVDEDTKLADTLAIILSRRGYTVAIAKDGLEAIQRVTERAFDITFMDIKMSLVDGMEVYKRMKLIRPDLEIVLTMKTHPESVQVKEALQDCTWGPLYKPFGAEKVFSIIEESKRVKTGALVRFSLERESVRTAESG
jgi:DNA-binding NtrC family response regulator